MPSLKPLAAAALCGLAVLPFQSAPAAAQARIEAGQLVCHSRGGIGLIVVSKKSFRCRFSPTGGRHAHYYTATITNVGIDLGGTGATTLAWTVLATTDRVAPGALAGTYAGAGADASIGVGGGASLLVGGSKHAISLQPLAGQVQTGVNIAAGIKGLKLRAS